MRIFILDDMAEKLASGLRASGLEATGFFHTDHALACIQEADILVAEYHLPETTGLEVVRRAHSQGWRGCALISMSYPPQFRESIDHPLILGIMVKPYDACELIEALTAIYKETVN